MIEIITVLADTENKSKWTKKLYNIRIIEEFGPYRRYKYFKLGTPFVLSNRDFLIEVSVVIVNRNKITIDVHSTRDNKVPADEGLIRATIHSRNIMLEQKGNETFITTISHTDPNGSVPKWIVNLFVKTTARQTIERLNDRISKRLYDNTYKEKLQKLIDTFPMNGSSGN